MEQMKRVGVVLLALGLCAACQKTDDTGEQPMQMAGAGTAGAGGSAGATAGGTTNGGDSSTDVRRGERGSSCDSTADCADDLTCVATRDCPAGSACASKSCQPSNFNLMGTGKSCHISQCTTKKDCCGDMPQQAPAKCANRDNICSKPTFPGCTNNLSCVVGSTTCGEGDCTARCNYDGKSCTVTADCSTNTCDASTQLCSVTQTDCSAATGSPCQTISNTCTLSPVCVCTNPDYDPTDSICTDPDCEGICGFTCKDDLCVVDDSCAADSECTDALPYCVTGACVECKKDADCEDEKCVKGHCGPECKVDTQCAVFEACQNGECAFVGCRTDRECVLQAREGAAPSQDPRLSKCQVANGIGTCVMPCDIDAQCAPTEVCLSNVCKYIGCETDAECKTIAGLHDLPISTEERPWVTSAVCKVEDPAAP